MVARASDEEKTVTRSRRREVRLLCLWASALSLALMGTAHAAQVSLDNLPYPGVVALSQRSPGKWFYQSFPKFLPLYIFAGEPEGKSTCDEICSAVWPIIQADMKDKPMGLWTIVKREDGRFQWAFKNKPVYTYFEDAPGSPQGVGKAQDWYLDAQEYLLKAGVPAEPLLAATARKKTSAKFTAVLLNP